MSVLFPSHSRSARLDRVLNELLSVSPELQAAAVVSFDGLPMASALPVGMDEDRVAAMSAALLSLGERAAENFGRGSLTQVYVEGENGTVFLVSADDEAVLVAVGAKGAKVGLLMFEVRRAAASVAEALRADDAQALAEAPVAPMTYPVEQVVAPPQLHVVERPVEPASEPVVERMAEPVMEMLPEQRSELVETVEQPRTERAEATYDTLREPTYEPAISYYVDPVEVAAPAVQAPLDAPTSPTEPTETVAPGPWGNPLSSVEQPARPADIGNWTSYAPQQPNGDQGGWV